MSGFINVFKRTEMKYLVNEEQYQQLKKYLDTIAAVDSYGKTKINNIYFDTPDFYLIRTSLEKPLYKEKIRLRTYGKTNDKSNSFIEIKKKYDGVVYKRRISGDYDSNYKYLLQKKTIGKEEGGSQISKEIDYFKGMYKNLIPAMKICYDRVAMIGKEDESLRITFDSNITWTTDSFDLKDDKYGKTILEEGWYMMEIKVTNAMPLELSRKLSELKIYPTSFSKYGKGYSRMLEEKRRRIANLNVVTVLREQPLITGVASRCGA
ncbi:MAG: polyphosphate polymerase domain-containing protein [Lachnospiraceae bacterium]|nr:polyphosphate polymerase domain-containing protein [Lachnospiraceae bacterium]